MSITFFLVFKAFTQSFSASIGTDIPYQHYLGINMELKNMDISYRTGILVPPYSDAILGILEGLGTDEVYLNLLDAAYEFGWMNSLGAYYKFGSEKKWYTGAEFRIDYLTASDSPSDLIEAVSGQTLNRTNFMTRNIELQLGLRIFASGFRFGKSFSLDSGDRHSLKTEFSVSKYIATQSFLQGNGNNLERINEEISRMLWEDVFRTYGYVGGLGLAYSYRF